MLATAQQTIAPNKRAGQVVYWTCHPSHKKLLAMLCFDKRMMAFMHHNTIWNNSMRTRDMSIYMNSAPVPMNVLAATEKTDIKQTASRARLIVSSSAAN